MKNIIKSVLILNIILSIYTWYLITEVKKPVFINQTILVETKPVNKASCEEVIKKLQIKNNCEEIKKIVNAFDNDPVFVATILHESNFDRMATNHKTKDYGIFQLNVYYWGKTNGNLDYSISKAKQCLKTNGMNCWISYKSGAYKSKLLDATQLINSLN